MRRRGIARRERCHERDRRDDEPQTREHARREQRGPRARATSRKAFTSGSADEDREHEAHLRLQQRAERDVATGSTIGVGDPDVVAEFGIEHVRTDEAIVGLDRGAIAARPGRRIDPDLEQTAERTGLVAGAEAERPPERADRRARRSAVSGASRPSKRKRMRTSCRSVPSLRSVTTRSSPRPSAGDTECTA